MDFLHCLSLAAQLVEGVVDVVSTAGYVLVVLAFHVPVAADEAVRVVNIGATAASEVVVLWLNFPVATDLGVLVVRMVTAAARAAEISAKQIAVATDVPPKIVEFAVTASLPVLVVDLISAASAVRIVVFEEDFVITAEMRVWVVGHFGAATVSIEVCGYRIDSVAKAPVVPRVVHLPTAAAPVSVVVSLVMDDSTAADLVSVVIDDASTATRVLIVAWKCAVAVIARWRRGRH